MTAAVVGYIRGSDRVLNGMAVAGALAATVTIGVAFALHPMFAGLPFAAVAFVLLLVSARFRLGFLVLGGILILQSSSDMGLAKFGYLAGVGTGFVGALVNLRGASNTESYRLLRPLLGLSALFGLLVVLSVGVSLAHGTPVTAWLRDAAPYLLFAAVPVFALDARSVSRRFLVAVFVVAGVLAAMSYTAEWLDRRHLADLPVTRFALPSGGLLSALYVFALSGALVGSRGRWWWAALGALILGLVWTTGNRAAGAILLLVALAAGAFAAKQEGTPVDSVLRVAAVTGTALVITMALIQTLVWTNDYDTGRMTGHVLAITAVPWNPGGDQSYIEREDQTRLAWRALRSKPVLGVAPGHVFQWTTAAGRPKSNFNLDTGMSFPAKFGVAGMVFLVSLGLAYGWFLRNAARGGALSVAQVALVAYAALALISMPFAAYLEDKGFSFGLLLLLALSLPGERERAPEPPATAYTGDV